MTVHSSEVFSESKRNLARYKAREYHICIVIPGVAGNGASVEACIETSSMSRMPLLKVVLHQDANSTLTQVLPECSQGVTR